MMICVLIGAATAAAANGQILYPLIGGPGLGSYMGVGPDYPGFYSYGNPHAFYNLVPHPRIGTYLPNQPRPPLPYVIPPTGLVLQPYPYFYQPPLYMPQPYIGPYYPPSMIPPYHYPYRRPYPYPRSTPWPSHRHRATPRQRQNVAPLGNGPSLRGYIRSLRDAAGAENPPADPNVETP
jgi:hypothetical protein